MKEEKTKGKLLRSWLKGELRYAEERQLERQASSDPFLSEAIQGYRKLPEADHIPQLDRMANRLDDRLVSDTRKHTKTHALHPIWPRLAAASVTLLVGLFAWWYYQAEVPSRSEAIAETEISNREVPPLVTPEAANARSLRTLDLPTGPSPESGFPAFYTYLERNSRSPYLLESAAPDSLRIRFRVNALGRPVEIEFPGSTGSSCMKNLQQQLEQGPAWSTPDTSKTYQLVLPCF